MTHESLISCNAWGRINQQCIGTSVFVLCSFDESLNEFLCGYSIKVDLKNLRPQYTSLSLVQPFFGQVFLHIAYESLDPRTKASAFESFKVCLDEIETTLLISVAKVRFPKKIHVLLRILAYF